MAQRLTINLHKLCIQKHNKNFKQDKIQLAFCSLRSPILANYILPLKWALGIQDSMQINFNNSDYLEIELLSRGASNYIYDCNLLVSFKSDIASISQDVWVDGYELKSFLDALEKLSTNLAGEASISSDSPGELLILIKSVDTSGHFAFQIEVGKQTFIGPEHFWSKVTDVFPMETAFLDVVCQEFISYFSDVKNA